MQRFYLLFGFAAFLFQPVNATGQTQKIPLTLQQAIQQAQEFNPDLFATLRDTDIAEADLAQAKSWPNPELVVLSEGLNEKYPSTTVQINQLIELGGKRSSRITAAERDKDAASADLVSQRAELRVDVAAAFFETLITQERIQIAEDSFQLAAQVNDVVKRRVAAGRISPIEATRTNVAELTMKSELIHAKTEFSLAKTRLAALWGDTVPKFDAVVKPAVHSDLFADFAADSSVLQAQLKNAPQLVRAQLEIDRQQAQVNVERSRQIGDVTVSVGNKRDGEFKQNQAILGITVPIPLFDRNQGNVLSALRKTEKARDELNALERQLSNQLAQAHQRFELAKAELMLLQTEILPQADSVIAATMKGFEFGKFSLLDVLEAQRTLFQTKLQYLKKQADFYQSATDIDRVLGLNQIGSNQISKVEK